MALTIQGYCQGVQSLRSSTTVASSRSHWSGHCHVERVSALYGVLDTLVLSSCTWYTFEWGFIPLSHFQLTFCQWSQQWLYESWSIYGLNILEFIDIPIMQAMEVQPGYRGVLCWRRDNSQAQKVRHDKTDWDDGVGWRVLSFFFPKMKCPKDEQLYMDVKPTVVWYIYNAFQDVTSKTAPAAPKSVDDDLREECPEAKPTPEQLGEKVSIYNWLISFFYSVGI